MAKESKNQVKEKNKKRHIDCAWLVTNANGYVCCDIRSPFHGKKMGREEAKDAGCDYFHEKYRIS